MMRNNKHKVKSTLVFFTSPKDATVLLWSKIAPQEQWWLFSRSMVQITEMIHFKNFGGNI